MEPSTGQMLATMLETKGDKGRELVNHILVPLLAASTVLATTTYVRVWAESPECVNHGDAPIVEDI